MRVVEADLEIGGPRCVRHWRERHWFGGVGRAEQGRVVFVVFTLRRRDNDVLIRPISARYMHDKEVESYENQNPGLPK